MDKHYCSKCGTPSTAIGAKFCSSCGSSFGVVSQPIAANEIEADEDGVINLALAKRAKQIDFEIQVPFEKQDGVSLRSVINPSEKQS
jgi:hypothetical protein